ncbi:hypothetical protein Taro_009767 [Colocasia esculenta]|uniref:Uncharacterized protein n=1 Tax=Colocasia esculenta TaxID=4460 RepID=A0A843U5R6_COLES|nr:hypothetical protein [Colocasia esculenta]
MGGNRRRAAGGGKGGGGQEEDLPLHTAARSGDMATVRSICSSNPLAVNARDRHSRSPTLELRQEVLEQKGNIKTLGNIYGSFTDNRRYNRKNSRRIINHS